MHQRCRDVVTMVQGSICDLNGVINMILRVHVDKEPVDEP